LPKILKLDYINPHTLSLSKNNVRKIEPDLNFKKLVDSVKGFGQIFEPIIINTKNEVIAGQRRWLASKEANLKTIPCIVVDFEDEKEEILLSWLENELQQYLDQKDKANAIRNLRLKGMDYDELEIKSGLSRASLHSLYMLTQVPAPIQYKTKEEKELADNLDKEVLAHRQESLKRARLAEAFRKIPKYQKDIHELYKVQQWALDKNTPLHDVEQALKEARVDLNVDVNRRKEKSKESRTFFFQTRWSKSTRDVVFKRAKRQNRDIHEVIENLARLWGNYKIDDQ